MVGILLDGRDCGPGAHAFAEDVARFLARDGEPTHLFVLVPTPVQSPQILHTVVRYGRPAARLDAEVPRPPATRAATVLVAHAANGGGAAPDDGTEIDGICSTLVAQLTPYVQRFELRALHAIGLDLPAVVARGVHAQTGVPYFVTPRGTDLSRQDERFQGRALEVLADARAVVAFDDETSRSVKARFEGSGRPLQTAVLERGIDLESFKPLRRIERGAVAETLLERVEITAPLDGIDWDGSYVILTVQPRGDRHGFEQFLFAVPELLRQQPALRVIVVTHEESSRLTDGLRAAMAAGRPEFLHDVVQSSELCQPLVDHLERLHQEGRTAIWWEHAARIEPERRVRFVGPLSRREFATLLRLADLFVLPGVRVRPPSQMFYEALACGVLPMASELSGIGPIVQKIAREISAEIASLGVLRTGVQPVREIEEKVGRIVRLRPELSDKLRALAVKEFDGQRVASLLRKLYAQPAAAVEHA
jgi:glycosyltransferase involved in cell wall biosynthesis